MIPEESDSLKKQNFSAMNKYEQKSFLLCLPEN